MFSNQFQEYKKKQEENKMAQKELELKKIKVEQENASFYGEMFTPAVKINRTYRMIPSVFKNKSLNRSSIATISL